MSKKRIFAISLSSLFAIAIIAFIFWNSSKVAEESVATSDKFTLILENTLAFFNITPNWDTLSFIIRKAGHFIEYFALGGTVAVLLYSLLLSKKFIVSSFSFVCSDWRTKTILHYILYNETFKISILF